MLFENVILKKDILREFSGYEIKVDESDNGLDIEFTGKGVCALYLRVREDMTLEFDRWHDNYCKTDNEYERLLWDIRDILENKAYAVSVMTGEHLFISFLTRAKMNSAEAFIDEDPGGYASLKKTGGVIKCAFRNESMNKEYIIEKD